MSRRLLISSPSDIIFERKTPVETIGPHLIEVALENLALYKQCYKPEQYDYILNAFFSGLIKISDLNPALSEGTSYIMSYVKKLVQEQSIKQLDTFLEDPSCLNYFQHISQIFLQSNDKITKAIKKLCQVFRITLIYEQNSSVIHFMNRYSIHCHVLSDEEYSYFYYYKMNSYINGKAIQTKPNNTEYYACAHSHDQIEHCSCRRYTIEDPSFFCALCNLQRSSFDLVQTRLCQKCYVLTLFNINAQEKLSINIQIPEKLDLLKELPKMGIHIESQEYCIVCTRRNSNLCKCMCVECFLGYAKQKKSCKYCQSKVDSSSIITCSDCKSKKGLKEEFFIYLNKHICIDCLMRFVKSQKFYYKLDKKLVNWLDDQGIEIKNLLICSDCKKVVNTKMACLCKCVRCASCDWKCSKCNYVYSDDTLELIYSRVCTRCLRKDCETLNEFQLCDLCSMELIVNKTQSYFGTFLVKSQRNIPGKKFELLKEEIKIDLRELFYLVHPVYEITLGYCLNCFDEKHDGCDCLCYDCADSFDFKTCKFCLKLVECMKISRKRRAFSVVCWCDEYITDRKIINIDNYCFCLPCLYRLVDININPITAARHQRLQFLSIGARIQILSSIREEFPEIDEFRCIECLKQRRASCCLLCIYCRKNYDRCPYCDSQICRLCYKYVETACNCTCFSCYNEYKLKSCLQCFSFTDLPNKSVEFLTIDQLDIQRALYLLFDQHKIANIAQAKSENLILVNRWLRKSQYDDINLLCVSCNQFKALNCNCTCNECALLDKECQNCLNYCKNCKKKVLESICPYSCECYECVSHSYWENRINSSCRYCRSPYQISLLKETSHFEIICQFCDQRRVSVSLLKVSCCRHRLVCLDCARNEMRSNNFTCRECGNSGKLAQFVFLEKITLIDCCLEVKDTIRLCNCINRHFYHAGCIPPCNKIK